MGKRLGIGKKGRVDSAGGIRISSVFSLMRDLAENGADFETHKEAMNDLSLERFLASLEESLDHREGLLMTAEEDI